MDIMVLSSTIKEVKESSSFDKRYGCSKGIFLDGNDSEGIFSELLRRMNPGSCFGVCGGGTDVNNTPSVSSSKLRLSLPTLMETIDYSEDHNFLPVTHTRRRNLALKSLYELASEKQNRVPMVCTQKYKVVAILARCLIESLPRNGTSTDDLRSNDETRRITCLILNQLSLPYQNKKVMVCDNKSHILIRNILHIINLRLPETYLCCIFLMNLTYLEAAVGPVLHLSSHTNEDTLQFRKSISNRPNNIDPHQWNNFPFATRVPATRVPSPVKGYIARGSMSSIQCLEDSQSLIRSIESLMHENRPFLISKILSIEGEAVRWSVGLMRNLTKTETHCCVIARTDIPFLIVSFLRQSPHSVMRWNKDSIEKMSLEVLANMAQFEETKTILLSLNTIELLKHIDNESEQLGLAINTAYIIKVLSS